MKTETMTSAGNCPVDGTVRPVAWVRDLGPQPHCVTDLRYCSASDVDSGAHMQYIPLYDQAALDHERNNADILRQQVEDLRAALAEVELLLDHCDEPTVWREKWAHVLGA
jgi:hypothetical protein